MFNHKHTLYVEGGVESIRYSIDLNYNSNGGAMKGSYRDRMGVGMSLDYRYKKLQIRNYVSYNTTRSEDSPYGLFSEYVKQLPYNEIYDDYGNLLKNFTGFAGAINPLWKARVLKSYSGRTRYHEVMDNFSLNLYLLDGLQFKGQFSITKTDQRTESFTDPNDPKYDYCLLYTSFRDTIANNSRDLLGLLDDVLDLSRLEAGQETWYPGICDMRFLVHSVLDIGHLNVAPGVELVERGPREELLVITDELKLTKVFLNLLRNAKKFTTRGYIIVGANVSEDGNWIECFVEDTGIGMSKESLSHVFDRFFEVNEFVQGTGRCV